MPSWDEKDFFSSKYLKVMLQASFLTIILCRTTSKGCVIQILGLSQLKWFYASKDALNWILLFRCSPLRWIFSWMSSLKWRNDGCGQFSTNDGLNFTFSQSSASWISSTFGRVNEVLWWKTKCGNKKYPTKIIAF